MAHEKSARLHQTHTIGKRVIVKNKDNNKCKEGLIHGPIDYAFFGFYIIVKFDNGTIEKVDEHRVSLI